MGAFGVTEKPADHDELAKVFSRSAPRRRRARRRRRAAAGRATQADAAQAVPELAGAKILIVDDDIRNIYSLTSVLESYDVEVLHAERGKDGIAILEQTPGIDVALIDIMMPEMDGYETMQQIRRAAGAGRPAADRGHRQGDEGRPAECLDAGASDYIAKPVDIDLLLALLRVWIGTTRSRTPAQGAGRAPADGGRMSDERRQTRSSPAEPSRSPTAPRLAGRRRRAPRVLVVDDDERNLLAIRTVLEDLAEVVVATFGRGGAAPPAQGRVRGHPARRLHARAWTATRPPRSSAAASRPSASRSSSCRRSTRRPSI